MQIQKTKLQINCSQLIKDFFTFNTRKNTMYFIELFQIRLSLFFVLSILFCIENAHSVRKNTSLSYAKSEANYNEKLNLAEAGVKEKDNQGNILVVDWVKHGTMVFVSQICPLIFKKEGGAEDTYLKKAIDTLKIKGKKTVEVKCGLDWIIKLAKQKYREEDIDEYIEREISKIKKDLIKSEDTTIRVAIEYLSKSDIDGFSKGYKKHKNGFILFITGLIKYIDNLKETACEQNVKRPGHLVSGCITDSIVREQTKDELKKTRGLLLSKTPEWKNIYHRMKIFSLFKDEKSHKEFETALANKTISKSFRVVKDYINHAMHTEAQIIIAKKILNDNLKRTKLISTKLPCWSCIRIPFLREKEMVAFELGLFGEELAEYQAIIKFADGSQSNLSKDLQDKHVKPIPVKLQLIKALDQKNRELFAADRRGEAIILDKKTKLNQYSQKCNRKEKTIMQEKKIKALKKENDEKIKRELHDIDNEEN